jgi:hypothetical protein
MTTEKRPPPNRQNCNVIPKGVVHERRVKKLIKDGIADMKAGKSAIFPMHKLIKAESDRLQAEISAFNRQLKNKRRCKKAYKKGALT